MQKPIKSLIGLLLLAYTAFTPAWSQNQILDANNVRVGIHSHPVLFWNFTGSPLFNVPKSGSRNPLFSSTLWIGTRKNQELYLAAETYRQSGPDFQSGPVSNNYSNLTKWNVAKVTRSVVESFKNDSTQWSNPPAEIANWPAHGDSSLGQAHHLAPFVNQGGDPDQYEPAFGDYPMIKGDQCTYYIFNDDRSHLETNGKKMGIEVHRMVYEVADTASFLDNTVFVEYRVFNRSNQAYDSLIFTIYSDFDLGNYDDDFIGTDTALNMTYVYNGKPADEGAAGYGGNPPAEGMVLLNKKLFSSFFYKNDNSVQGNPDSAVAEAYFNYMQGRWKTGVEMTYGDSGLSGSTPTRFAFTGDVCAQTGWTESSGGTVPGDRRIIGSVIFPPLHPGGSEAMVLAYVFAQGQTGATSSVCKLQSEAQRLHAWYAQQPHTGLQNTLPAASGFTLYPNPSNGMVHLRVEHPSTFEVLDLSGRKIIPSRTVQSEALFQLETAGIYLIKVQTADRTEYRKLVVN